MAVVPALRGIVRDGEGKLSIRGGIGGCFRLLITKMRHRCAVVAGPRVAIIAVAPRSRWRRVALLLPAHTRWWGVTEMASMANTFRPVTITLYCTDSFASRYRQSPST